MKFICLFLIQITLSAAVSARHNDLIGTNLRRSTRDLIGYNRLGNNIYNWYGGRFRQVRNGQTANVFQQMMSSPDVSQATKNMIKRIMLAGVIIPQKH